MVSDKEKLAPNLRILRMLEVIADMGKAVTPTELNESLGLPKQSLHRLCSLLIEQGYLEKSGRKLYPSPKLLTMASGLSQLSSSSSACHQILCRVAYEFGETVNFVRPEKNGMNYVDRVETNWPFRILLPIGTHVPFHCTASGKTYLASLPKTKQEQMLRALQLSPLTPRTLNSPDTLRAELAQIKAQKYATDQEEFYEGMVALAVPVYDANRRFFAALAVHGPKSRFCLDNAVSQVGILTDAAKEIRQVLFAIR